MPIWKINKDQKRNDNVTAKILQQAALRDKLGTIEDLPLQTEYPETVFIPAAAEIKAAGSIGRGLLRTVGGLVLGNVGAKDIGRIGNTIDNTLNTKVFTPALGFVGGLGGYVLGSGLTNAMIPRKVTYGPTDYRTILADDQTPRYNSNQLTTDYAKVKYYGPTMGKSYAAKQNPNLIDLDTYGMPEYNQLAKKYGYKDWREMILSNKGDYNAEYKDLIKAQIRRLQTDPNNAGKTIMVSNASLLKPNSGITFANIPVIPERSVMAARNHERHPWESVQHGEEWWDSLQAKGTPLKIDNRYVSEIEKIPYQKPTTTKDTSFELEDPINTTDYSNWTDAQWDAAYNKAVNSGNITEAQRLRDLHFTAKSPDNKLIIENENPLTLYHFSDSKFNFFDPKKIGNNDPGFYGKGIYSSPNKAYASTYGPIEYKLYGYSKKPFETLNDEERSAASFSFNRINDGSPMIDLDGIGVRKELENADAVYQQGVSFARDDKPVWEVVVPKSNQLKLVDPITYDDNGQIIPLSKRDNFSNPDIRWGVFPLTLGLGLSQIPENKQGGVIKGQIGLSNLPVNPQVIKRVSDKLNSFLNPIEDWENKYNVTAKAGSGILSLVTPEAWVGIDAATLTPQHFGNNGIKALEEVPNAVKKVSSIVNKSGTARKVRTAEEKHQSFLKGLDTWSQNKYGIKWSNMKKDVQPRIETEYRGTFKK